MRFSGILAVVALLASAAGPQARAESAAKNPAGAALRALVGFLAPGGYFPTSGVMRDKFGSSKWAGEFSLHAKPKRIGTFLLSGGFDRISASDHFLPFSGGNELSLTGVGVRLTTPERAGRVRPVLTAGLYAGHIRCDSLGLATTVVTPSCSVGAEWKIARYAALSASYRVATPIGGLSPDGFGVYLRLF